MEFRCDALLLDMDGTLVDSTECVERQWRRWAGRHGLDVTPILRISHGRTTMETIRAVAPHLATAEEVLAFDAAEAEDSAGVRPVRGAIPFLSRLPADRWAVVTSAMRMLAQARLECAGIPIPRVLVCADDVRRGKPDPEPYLTAARWIGWPAARCLVIEDVPPGVQAAQTAGMQVLGVTTTVACEQLGVPCIRDFDDLRMQRDGSGALRISVAG